ncbi:MAG: succinate dehydrogenase iron-sulfur subunit [Verrucomicrobia bacterium]|nr:succinate dehydrogenase iron-sulfur subunit [Verrucomicrobiota bacterium]
MSHGKFVLKILRGTEGHQYWEEFECDRMIGLNLIGALLEIQKNPVTRQGKKVEPVAWEMACLEEVCGSCSMLVNGIPCQACTVLIEDLIKQSGSTKITLAPFSKFPVVRDLVINRDSMFTTLKRIEGWVPVENLHSEEFGPKISPTKQEAMYTESTCMTCGCCLEACPQVNKRSSFMGAAGINQVKYFNANPIGAALKKNRLRTLMEKGGISECGKSMNCVQVCPKEIPLTQSIAQMGKDVSKEYFKVQFGLPENDTPTY